MHRGLCVLICARDEIASRRLGFQLAGLGVQYEWTRTAQDAIRRLASDAFDALAVDLILPDQDGISLMRALREAGIDIPIVGLSLRCDSRPARNQLHAAIKLAQIDAASERARAIFALKVATQRMEGYHPRVLALTSDTYGSELLEGTLDQTTRFTAAHTMSEARLMMGRDSFDLALADPEFLEDETALHEFAGACPNLPLILNPEHRQVQGNSSGSNALSRLANIIRTYAMLGHCDTVGAHA